MGCFLAKGERGWILLERDIEKKVGRMRSKYTMDKKAPKIWWLPSKRCIERILNGINSMYKLQNWSGLGGFVFRHWLLNPLIFTQSLDTSPLSGLFSSQNGPSDASTVSQHIQLMVYRIRDIRTSWYGRIYIHLVLPPLIFLQCFTWEPTGDKPGISAPSTGDLFSGFPSLQDSQSRLILTPRRSRSPISPSPRWWSRSRCCFEIGEEVDDWRLILPDTAMKI